jgi:hypothetical protein
VLIEEYFQQIEQEVSKYYFTVTANISTDKRSLYLGIVEGKLTFIDSSELHFMEFVNVKTELNRYKYPYHYQDKSGVLIFRYDMAPHHKELSAFPHHKHLADEHVIDAAAPSLAEVLEEIEQNVAP